MLQTCKILVATSCAGTGLDIRSVGQIVVVGRPYSVEQLLQWAGRLREDGFISVFTSASHLKENSELSGESSGQIWYWSDKVERYVTYIKDMSQDCECSM